MDNSIIIGKAAVRSIKGHDQSATFDYRKLGKAAEEWLAVDVSPKRKASEFAEKVGGSEAMVSKGRTIARKFSSDAAIKAACKAANLDITVENVYGLSKDGGGSSEKAFDPAKVAASFARSHSDMTKVEFEAFVREARKLFA